MRPKNYGELSETVLSKIKESLEGGVSEISVGDSANAGSPIIRVDLRNLLYGAVMDQLEKFGVTKVNATEGYDGGISEELEELVVEIRGNRMRVYAQRNKKATDRMIKAVEKIEKA